MDLKLLTQIIIPPKLQINVSYELEKEEAESLYCIVCYYEARQYVETANREPGGENSNFFVWN